MVHVKFQQALTAKYSVIKSKYPGEGRRKWRLRVLHESWATFASNEGQPTDNQTQIAGQDDPDPFDTLLEDGELGLIIRTDFTNDAAWNTLCGKVVESQNEFIADLKGGAAGSEDGAADAQEAVAMKDESQGAGEDAASASDSESESDPIVPNIIKILDPQEPEARAKFANLSNIAALRLFNNVDIRPAPDRPTGTKPFSPSNLLIDQGGWQEIYGGKNLWIYDSRSNSDECVRVVGQTSDFYGTATGDSWRARGTHVCELQFNMAYQGLRITFNGMDNWDQAERARNLAEALQL